MSHDHLPPCFSNVSGKELPPDARKQEGKRKKNNPFNRKQQLRGQRATDKADANRRERMGHNSFGFRPKDK